MYIIQIIRGFCMALADSVPGVSGGTVAFLLGFYDEFITSIDDLLTGNMEKRKKAFMFLFKMGIGWVVGFILAVLVLTNVFESHIYAISSLFIGFIIFAIPIVVVEEKEAVASKKWAAVFIIVGIAVVTATTYLNPVSAGEGSVNLKQLSVSTALYVFIAGAIAISAMVLPGISGSTLLLVMGLYLPIITAMEEFLHMNFAALPVIIIFCLGIFVGILSVVKIIRKALESYRAQTIYLIIGLMIGSLYSVVMGPTTLEVPQPAMTLGRFDILFFLIGGAVILALQMMKQKKED